MINLFLSFSVTAVTAMKCLIPSLMLMTLGWTFSTNISIQLWAKLKIIPPIRFLILIKLASYSKRSPWKIKNGLSLGIILARTSWNMIKTVLRKSIPLD